GSVTVHAERVPAGSPLDDFIKAVDPGDGDVDAGDDTITFPQHGLISGDVVTYDPNGFTAIKTDDTSKTQDLQSGIKLSSDPTQAPTVGGDPNDENSGVVYREYPVLVVDPNTIKLGVTFNGKQFTGDVTFDAAALTLQRPDGASWQGEGFAKGQTVQVTV